LGLSEAPDLFLYPFEVAVHRGGADAVMNFCAAFGDGALGNISGSDISGAELCAGQTERAR
jgi:hypothetical protein